jgi:hypothetical protein
MARAGDQHDAAGESLHMDNARITVPGPSDPVVNYRCVDRR